MATARFALLATLTFAAVGASTVIPDVAVAQDAGIPVEIRVVDAAGEPIPTAVVRNPDEGERHPVNTITGAYATDVLFMPDGQEKVFTKGMELQFEISAPGYVTANVVHVVRKRRNVIAVTLEEMQLDLLDDLEEPVIQFGRDRPIDGATPAESCPVSAPQERVPMIRILMALPLAALLPMSAQATTWADYEEAFPAFPCMDGWMACYQGGERVTPDLQRRGGMPSPANARVDWFTLEPTTGFSPFVQLTSYSMGGAPAPEPAVADVDPMPEPYDMPDPEPYTAPEPYAAPDPTPGSVDPEPQMVRPDPEPQMVRPEPQMVRPGPEPQLVRPDPEPQMVRPGPQPSLVRPQPVPDSPPNIEVVRPEPVVPAPLVADNDMVRPGPEPTPPGPVSCDDLVRLESSALIGRLTDEQVACLEASFADVTRQTEKKKISLLPIANANGKGDKRAWEGLVRRHLEDIDQSDPDICYAYATHLARKGPGRAESVIRWSEVALENRTRWVGETYKSRVYNLYKLRAAAANTLWQRAEEAHASAQTDESESAVERTRGRLKTYAREWYEYAKEAGKDTTVPRQLCVSAAGTSEFCEGR